MLGKLNEAVVFEDFLHKKYIGQKRFSLEGGEAAIPALATIVNVGARFGLKEVCSGREQTFRRSSRRRLIRVWCGRGTRKQIAFEPPRADNRLGG